ncbi:MAG: helix-turn-helix domain-containing protein [Verrucomicrobiaceae bacterium]|nr:helix-turn-helix domain-containing protein [Verrucomicrobiaceae bacterium]
MEDQKSTASLTSLSYLNTAGESSSSTTLWTIDDVANYARCSVRHVTTLREQGLPYRKLGHLVRFSPESVKRWFEG